MKKEQVSKQLNTSGISNGHLTLLDVFDKETLERFQQAIANVTGLGVITSDYKGMPLTEMTSFTEFCHCIRKKSEQLLICNLSDAFGIAQSAVTQKACIYQCPCGLMEMAIPIVIDGQFLGGFLAGQVKCPDAKENITRFSSMVTQVPLEEKEQDLYEKIPEMEYDKFCYIAELVFQIINLMAEKSMAQLQANSATSIENSVLKTEINKLEYKNSLLEIEMEQLKSRLQPMLLHHVINDMANMSLIENAQETNQMLLMYHDYMQHTFDNNIDVVTLHTELESIDRYFQLFMYSQKDRFQIQFNVKKEYMIQRIPANVLLSLIEKAVFPFVDGIYHHLSIEVSAMSQQNTFCVKIKSHYIMNQQKSISQVNEKENSVSYIQKSMASAKQKLELYFGDKYEITEHQYNNRESDIIIKYPMYFKERII